MIIKVRCSLFQSIIYLSVVDDGNDDREDEFQPLTKAEEQRVKKR